MMRQDAQLAFNTRGNNNIHFLRINCPLSSNDVKLYWSTSFDPI